MWRPRATIPPVSGGRRHLKVEIQAQVLQGAVSRPGRLTVHRAYMLLTRKVYVFGSRV